MKFHKAGYGRILKRAGIVEGGESAKIELGAEVRVECTAGKGLA